MISKQVSRGVWAMKRAAYFALLLVHLGAVFPVGKVQAQGDATMELYGEGVHRFFAGDLSGAEVLFSRVIESGSQDPRAFYFRGLVQEHLGGLGDPDFEQGARLEAEGRLSVPVGDSLTRIQGLVRSKIEEIRRDARVEYRQQRLAEQQAQMESLDSVPGVSQSTEPDAVEEPAIPDSTPFEEGMRSDEVTELPTEPAVPEVDASSDPFQDDPAAPATEAPAEAPAADPFGEAPATTDPFGGSNATEPAADPFGGDSTPPASGAADPFGGDSGAPAGGTADPFGGDSTPPAGGADDPFGGSDPFGNG
jgi:hypothetical protein